MELLYRLAEQGQSRVEERYLMSDRVHILLSIPRSYAASKVAYMKGNSASLREHRQDFVGEYFGSQVGRDEAAVKS